VSEKECELCNGTGYKIKTVKLQHGIINISMSIFDSWFYGGDCRKCNGTGWYNENDIISIPKKYVHKSFWELDFD